MNYSKLSLLSFFSTIFVTSILSSCAEDDPQGPPPALPPGAVWRKLDDNGILTAASQFGKGQQATPLCVNPGRTCIYITPQPPPIGIPVQASLENFRAYYSNNNVAGYFANDPNWAIVFPQLNLNMVAFSKIISGEYHTWMPLQNTVVFYSGSFVGAGNFSLGFVFQ